MSACNRFRLVRFIDRKLDEGEEWEVLDHLGECNACSDVICNHENGQDRAFYIFPLPLHVTSSMSVVTPRISSQPTEVPLPRVLREPVSPVRSARLESLVSRMGDHLRAVFPDEWGPAAEPTLRRFILAQSSRAAIYGVDSEEDLGLYLEFATVHGHDFDTNPRKAWASEILRSRFLNGSEKMDRLEDYEIFDLPYDDQDS